ncbi:hypothetical protein LCGC14_2028800 [marine sediment metagenome]|uniref:Uncharacterized protein n=1 Tax=marine sediment metagenome TaxID=412755 RepID=A0A0F9FHU2_9ZZZZ
MKFYCVANSCSALAKNGHDKCGVHLGTALRDRFGFVIYTDGNGRCYCHDCKKEMQIDHKGICSEGHRQ